METASAEAVAAVGPRVLIVGYYGRGNPGDEALMEAAVKVVADAGCVPVVATDDPSSVPPGAETVPRTALFGLRVLRAISRCDVVLFGGGGIFQDVTSLRSLLFYAKLALKAKAEGKALLLVAQGVGPLRRGISRRLVRRVFEAADMADVRDERSRQLLSDIGVNASKVTVSADFSFLLAEEVRRLQSEGRRGIAVFPRPVPKVGALDAIATAAVRAAGECQTFLRFVPFQAGADREVAEHMADVAMGAERARTPRNWRSAARRVAESELAVCMRLHALAFAAMTGTPAVAVPYDPKVEALADLLGVPHTGGLDDITHEKVYTAIKGGWERREELAERERAACERLKAKAAEAAERLKQFLRRGS